MLLVSTASIVIQKALHYDEVDFDSDSENHEDDKSSDQS